MTRQEMMTKAINGQLSWVAAADIIGVTARHRWRSAGAGTPWDIGGDEPAQGLWVKWHQRSAEAKWSMGWHSHSPTLMPLSLGIGRTFVRHGLPPMSFFVTGQWMLYRQFAPIAPQTAINFGVTIAFPQFRDFWGS